MVESLLCPAQARNIARIPSLVTELCFALLGISSSPLSSPVHATLRESRCDSLCHEFLIILAQVVSVELNGRTGLHILRKGSLCRIVLE